LKSSTLVQKGEVLPVSAGIGQALDVIEYLASAIINSPKRTHPNTSSIEHMASGYLSLALGFFVISVACLQFGLGVWEATVASANPVASLKDGAQTITYGYIVTKCVLNFLGSFTLFTNGASLACFDDFSPSSVDEDNCQLYFFQVVGVGISIWGAVLWFDFNATIEIVAFRQVLFVELIVFFVWCGIVAIMAFFVIITVFFEICWQICCTPKSPPLPTFREERSSSPHHKHLNIYQYEDHKEASGSIGNSSPTRDLSQHQQQRQHYPIEVGEPSEEKVGADVLGAAEAEEQEEQVGMGEITLNDEVPPV